jgi:hypothetical protein
VEVVGHQAIGQHGHGEYLIGLAQGLEEGLLIAVLEEDLAAGVTAVEDVVAEAAAGGAGGAWHGDRLAEGHGLLRKK